MNQIIVSKVYFNRLIIIIDHKYLKSNRNIARTVGVLFLLQMTTAVISHSVILQPIFRQTDYLIELASNATAVRMAVILDLLCGASVFAISVLLFPILKKFSERLALWYVGVRLTELLSFMISGFILLTLLKIGMELNMASANELGQSESIAAYLRNARGNLLNISLLIYCLGAWSFYGLLYYSRLLPRFISVWGILGVCLLFIKISSSIFGSSVGGIWIMMPLGLNELFLGLWLIIKGFNFNKASSRLN